MSRNVSNVSTLGAKFAIGEIADFVGVPDFYDAGDSKWLRTGTWVASGSVPASLITQLKTASATSVALTDNTLINEQYSYINGMLPPAIVGDVRCFSYSSGVKGVNAHAFVVNSVGPRVINIGQATGYSQGNAGAGTCITSDGTKFWSWVAASATAFGAKSSANGETWDTETLSGQPTFSALTTHQIGGTSNTESSFPIGEQFYSATAYNLTAAYCGARHLLIGLNGSNQYVASSSSNGTTFGGDQTVAVLGSATITATSTAWWNRNGLNFFWTGGNVSRFSADGGATWVASTSGALSADYYRVNTTDAARIMAFQISGTSAKVTTNSGQSWTAVTLPLAINHTTARTCGRGGTWAVSQGGTAYQTVNDGAAWTAINAPIGFGAISAIYSDASRWYLFSASSNQIATSTDLATWTIRNITTPIPNSTTIPNNLVATDSNTVVGCHAGNILYTTDGGVTWYWSYATNAATATAADVQKIIANTTGTNMILSAACGSGASNKSIYIPASALSGTPAAVRSTATAVTPLRTNALAFSRVA